MQPRSKLTKIVAVAPDIKGKLSKLKSGNKLFGNTNTRWFELCFSRQKFGYKYDVQDATYKKIHSFHEILNFHETLPQEEKRLCKWQYGFQVIVLERAYSLYCQTEEQYLIWVAGFKLLLQSRIFRAIPPNESVFQAAIKHIELPFLKSQGIPREVFEAAIKYFVEPYNNEIQKERLKKLKEERERQEEERQKKLLEEENEKKRQQEEARKLKFKLYGEDHEKIYFDADKEYDHVKITENQNIVKLGTELNFTKNVGDTIPKDNELCFNLSDAFDFTLYDRENKPVQEDNLIKLNPVLAKQNKTFGTAFHSTIRGYIDPTKTQRNQINLENPHVMAISQTEDNQPAAATANHKRAYKKLTRDVSPMLKSIIACTSFNFDFDGNKQAGEGDQVHCVMPATKPQENLRRKGTVTGNDLKNSVMLVDYAYLKDGNIAPRRLNSAIEMEEEYMEVNVPKNVDELQAKNNQGTKRDHRKSPVKMFQ